MNASASTSSASNISSPITDDNIVNIPFKLLGKYIPDNFNELDGLTRYYDVDISKNINDFMNSINYNIKTDFGVSTFEIIPHHHNEDGLDLKQYLMTAFNNYESVPISQLITSDTGFYIRAISLTEKDIIAMSEIQEGLIQSQTCPVCLTRHNIMSRYFVCDHEICAHCFVSWNLRMQNEARGTTCPICRSN